MLPLRSPSDLSLPQGLFRKQVFDGQAPGRQSLFIRVLDHRLERRPVRFDSVGPVVFAEDLALLFEERKEPRQSVLERRGIVKAGERDLLRLLEGVVEVDREPGICLVYIPADDDEVHDRKKFAAPVILLFHLVVVGKEPAHLTPGIVKRRRNARRHEGVDLSFAHISLKTRSGGISSSTTPGGRSNSTRPTAWFVRPGSSSPPIRQRRSVISTPYSCLSMPRIHRPAVINHSGHPMILPLRSFGSLIPESAWTKMHECRKNFDGKTGIAMKGGGSLRERMKR